MSSKKLGLGTAQFGGDYGVANSLGQVKEHEVKKILDLSLVNGIHVVDTAIEYGESEKTLGICGVSKLQVITKLPVVPENHSDIEGWVTNQVKKSLKRLKVEKLYGLLLHRPEQLLSIHGDSIYKALKKIKDLGLVNKIGVSTYDPHIIKDLLKTFRIDIVQTPLNLIDRRFIEGNYHKLLKDLDIEIHVRSVFMQGLLLIPKLEIPKYFNSWDSIWRRWHNWLDENSAHSLDTCLSFALAYPEVDQIIVGADSCQQWASIIQSMNANLHDSFPNIGVSDPSLINPSNWAIKQ
ncbi:aldo/keto reductase [Gammaproteobacteria bacterium]|jgi:aryl-alcohol dehydrogenase-like predicted oxidoreductase|nr:aldo/keto reductase [Gammaproteobacteria bacterium]